MQLRMLARRSLNGSMTIVGDIAQATGAWAHADWDEILAHLPDRRPPRRAELTIGYRIPAPNMALAARVLAWPRPTCRRRRSVREDGDAAAHRPRRPSQIGCPSVVAAGHGRGADRRRRRATSPSSVPASLVDAVAAALDAAGIEHGGATRHGLDQQVTVVPVGW